MPLLLLLLLPLNRACCQFLLTYYRHLWGFIHPLLNSIICFILDIYFLFCFSLRFSHSLSLFLALFFSSFLLSSSSPYDFFFFCVSFFYLLLSCNVEMPFRQIIDSFLLPRPSVLFNGVRIFAPIDFQCIGFYATFSVAFKICALFSLFLSLVRFISFVQFSCVVWFCCCCSGLGVVCLLMQRHLARICINMWYLALKLKGKAIKTI